MSKKYQLYSMYNLTRKMLCFFLLLQAARKSEMEIHFTKILILFRSPLQVRRDRGLPVWALGCGVWRHGPWQKSIFSMKVPYSGVSLKLA